MAILLDTGFYAGLIHPKDEHHQDSISLLDQIKDGLYGQVYTSNYIMTETATLCSIRSERNPRVLATCQDYFIGTLKLAIIIYARDVNDKETWELFQKTSQDASIKKPLSFIDCTNIILAKHYQIEYIASFDPHFDAWLTRIPSSLHG
ncbi:MAG TPA: PIN domain-containing protein [Candidatus Lokiarchaeia archaeon]|nr:PIN domain-containing protein [Candidatus Lokiarchaeia archaeon]